MMAYVVKKVALPTFFRRFCKWRGSVGIMPISFLQNEMNGGHDDDNVKTDAKDSEGKEQSRDVTRRGRWR